jgi:hypothetical protein
VTWWDPAGTTQGREAMNEQGQKLLDRLPNFVFPAAGPVSSPATWDCLRTTLDCLVSLRRLAASTLGWFEMDRSRTCTRC